MVALVATAQKPQRSSTVHLKSGEYVTGVITSRSDQSVEIVVDDVKYVYSTADIDYITHESRKKNYDTSKFRGFVDLGYSLGFGSPRNDYWLIETSFGYQFTPNYYLGAGLGLHNMDAKVKSYPYRYDKAEPEHIDPDWKYPFVPIYLEGRYNVRSESHNTPWASLKLGANTFNYSGLFASPSVGFHFATNEFFSFNIGIGYALHTAKYKKWVLGDTPGAKRDDRGGYYLHENQAFHNAYVKVGVEF